MASAKQIGTITLNDGESEAATLPPETAAPAPSLDAAWRYRDADGLWVGRYVEENGALVEGRYDVYETQPKGNPVRVK
jgi:hypothetical protein